METEEEFQLNEDFSECLRLGILHGSSCRFLTAEIFNNEITVSGTALRRRQIWNLIVERGRPDCVYLQSHLGRFLSTDKDGKVNGAAKYPGDCERFLLEYNPQATGEWAFRSAAHGYYLSGSDTHVSCFSKGPVWWAIRLAIHPQIHLKNHFRARYSRSVMDDVEIRTDRSHPWGAETLLWIEQHPMGSGSSSSGMTNGIAVGRKAASKYGRVAFRTEKGLYLKADGSLVEEMDDSVLFTFELHPGNPRTYAFRDSSGAYLSAIGPGTLRVKSSASPNPGKEELFLIERASLQVGIQAENGKFASVKQSAEISANQHEPNETAVFQLEYIGGKGFRCADAITATSTALPQSPAGDTELRNSSPSPTNDSGCGMYSLVTGHWRLRINSGKLWRIPSSAAVQNNGNDGDADTLFEILTVPTSDFGRVVLRSHCGESVSAKKLGAVSSSGRQVSQTVPAPTSDLFRLIWVNRPSVALLSLLTGGFVCRGRQTLLDCSNGSYERFQLKMTTSYTYQIYTNAQINGCPALFTACPDGFVHLKRGTPQSGNEPPELGTEFLFHFLGNGRFLIQIIAPVETEGFNLVRADNKGEVKWGSAADIAVSHIWEV